MSKGKAAQNSQGTDHLNVLDMGLDFRSYLGRVDDNGTPILGNVIAYHADKVADVFEPTVGLLVTVLHIYSISPPSYSLLWLKTYDTIQRVYIDHSEGSLDSKSSAQTARDTVANHISSGNASYNRELCEKLLQLLDEQSGFKGAQAPSQRNMPRDPKGAFCNLHLADHKCYQEFSCNQLHLHEAGPVRHRMNFFQKLAEIFVKEKVPRSEVVNRVKDSIFFARYGNKVTVKFHGTWVPFFKTLYTDGRLEQAFRQQHYSCNDYSCKNEHCKGIHCQDKKLPPHGKPMDLHNSPLIASELAEEADHIVSAVENTVMTPLSTPLISQLPTQDLWKATVRDYVRQSGIPQVEADETLLKTLQDVKISGTPLSSTSDRMTPIFDYPDLNGFNLSLSSMNSEPR